METARIRVESSKWNPSASLSHEQGRARAASLTAFPAGQGMPKHPEPGQAAGNAQNSRPGGTFPVDHPSPSPPGILAGLCSAPPAPLTKQDVFPGMPPKEPRELPDPQAQERLPAPPATGPSQGGFPGAAKAEFPGSGPGTQRIFVRQRRARQKGVYSGERQIKKGHFSLRAEQRLLTAAFPCPGPAPAPK